MIRRIKPFAAYALAFWLAAMGASGAAADYQYFRMYGRWGSLAPTSPPPAGVLMCTMGGPATVAVDAPFASSPTVAGAAPGPMRFTVAYGVLPPGLELDGASGVIAGAIAAPGAYNAILTVNDVAGATGMCPFGVTATGSSGFIVTGSPVLIGTVGGGYSATFSSVGGSAPYVFQAASGLPPGLAISPNGALAGIPTTAGVYPDIVIAASDSAGHFAEYAPFTLTIYDPLGIQWAPPSGTAGVPYSSQASASGGHQSYAFTMTAIPPGLTLDRATGELKGTPTTAGDYVVTGQVRDEDGRSATTPLLVISINGGADVPDDPLTVSSWRGDGEVGVAYLGHVGARGGVGGYAYSLVAGSLPDGLALAADGTLSGTPTTAGKSTGLVVQAEDRQGRTGVSDPFSITINPPEPLQIVAEMSPDVVLGARYSAVFTAVNGSGAGYTFAATGASWPPGLAAFSQTNGVDAVLSGKPTQIGTYPGLQIQVTDSAGHVAALSFSITVSPPPPLKLVGSPGGADLDTPYSFAFSARGGSGGYIFDISDGALPDGLTFTPAGVLSGTPTRSGTSTFTVRVSDQAGATASANFLFPVNGPLALAATAPPYAVIGESYFYQLQASGGHQPYTFSADGALPPGIYLDAPTGMIAGRATAASAPTPLRSLAAPTSTGTRLNFPMIFTVADANGASASQPAAIRVFDPITVSVDLPPATVGEPYDATPTIAGGDGDYTLWLGDAAASLQAFGLTIDPQSGVISGTPTAAGRIPSFVFGVTDGVGASPKFPTTVQLVIYGPPVFAGSPGPAAPDSPYGFQLKTLVSGGRGPYAFALVAGALPRGMSLDADGTVSAVAVTGATTTATIRVTDADGRRGDASLTFTVGEADAMSAFTSPAVVRGGATLTGTLATSVVSPSWSFAQIPSFPRIDLSGGGAAFSGPAPNVDAPTVFSVIATASSGTGVNRSAPPMTVTVLPELKLNAPGGLRFGSQGNVFGPTDAPFVSGLLGTASYTLLQNGVPVEIAALCPGLAFDVTTGRISGLPPSVCFEPLDLQVQVTDSYDGATAAPNSAFGLKIDAATASAHPDATNLRGGAALAGSLTSSLTSPTWTLAQIPASPDLGLSVNGSSFAGIAPVVSGLTGYSIVATASQNGVQADARPFTLLVAPPFAVSGGPAGPQTAFVGFAYASAAPIATGVGGTVDWTLTRDGAPYADLPTVCPGLDFSTATGVISGTAAASCRLDNLALVGTDSFDRQAATAGAFSITVGAANASAALIASSVRSGAGIAGTLNTNLSAPVWSFAVVPATPSLALKADGKTLTFSGTAPVVASSTTFEIVATATSGSAYASTTALTLVVDPAPAISGGPAGTISGSVGNAVAATPLPTVSDVKGTAGFLLFKDGVPYASLGAECGLAFDFATGVVSGTPTRACSVGGLALAVIDSFDGTVTASATTFGVSIAPATASATLSGPANLRTGAAISGALSSSLSAPAWSLTQWPVSPDLGLSISGAAFSGTAPAVPALTAFSLAATAASGAVQASGTASVNVAPAFAVSGGPAGIVAGDLGIAIHPSPAASVGATAGGAVTFALTKDGAPYAALASDCTGLSFSAATGVISGNPSKLCTISGVRISATDAYDGATASTAPFDIVIASAQTQPTGSFAAGASVGTPYSSGPLAVSGGSAPYAWSLASGSLGLGLSLDASTGVISGTPSGSGTLTFTVKSTDAYSAASPASGAQTITVSPATATAAMATPASGAWIRQGGAVTGTLTTTLPNPVWTFTVSPSGPALTLVASGNASSATFSGIAPAPTVKTTYTMTATATSGVYSATTPAVNFDVMPPIAIAAQNLYSTAGTSVSWTPQVSNVGTPTFALLQNGTAVSNLGSLCAGLSFSTSSGTISGTPSGGCSVANLAYRVSDSDGSIATSGTFSITVIVPTTVFLTASSTWTVPAGVTLLDSIECVGGGGSGAVIRGLSAGATISGGGGGAYSKSTNIAVAPGAGINVVVGAGGAAIGPLGSIASVAGNNGGDTYFNATSAADATAQGPALACLAQGGRGGAKVANGFGAGGAAASGVGVVKYSGGSSGVVGPSGGLTGGGGAAGRNGNGNNGVDSTSGFSPSAGGAGDAGFGGAGSNGVTSNSSGPAGGAGAEWDATHGSGGGSGAQFQTGGTFNGVGGKYGGGSGGAGASSTSTAGVNAGGAGLVVVKFGAPR